MSSIPCSAWNSDDWLSELKLQLEVVGKGYLSRSSNDRIEGELATWPAFRSDRTTVAIMAVAAVSNAIAKLPEMGDHVGLAPLHDLQAALLDLLQGGQPELLRPVPGVGNGGEKTGERWVRQYALLFVLLLEATDMNAGTACKVVAQALAKAGHVGKKKAHGPKPLSQGTVAYWRSVSRQRGFAERDPMMAAFLDRNMDRLRSCSAWPLHRAAAIKLVEEMIDSPLMRSKSGFPPT